MYVFGLNLTLANEYIQGHDDDFEERLRPQFIISIDYVYSKTWIFSFRLYLSFYTFVIV